MTFKIKLSRFEILEQVIQSGKLLVIIVNNLSG